VKYRRLGQQNFEFNGYEIIPIRFQDRYLIMNWRNEQLYHLRQDKTITYLDQDKYFNNVIANSFSEESPKQILFSYLKDNICIGYGGLVHINWVDKNAEISFLINTELEQTSFALHWSNFLNLIETVAFKELNLHKLFVYAFDLRPHLYSVLKNNKYYFEALLKEHCFYNGEFISVIIHSKIRTN